MIMFLVDKQCISNFQADAVETRVFQMIGVDVDRYGCWCDCDALESEIKRHVLFGRARLRAVCENKSPTILILVPCFA